MQFQTTFHVEFTYVLAEPFLLDPAAWIPVPANWARNTVQGKTYDTTDAYERALWDAVRSAVSRGSQAEVQSPADLPEEAERYGAESLTRGRLGQGAKFLRCHNENRFQA